MRLARRLLLGLVLACTSLGPARAALIIDVALKPESFASNPPFGLTVLPGEPFLAHFALAHPLPANFAGVVEVGAFAATIGNQTWDQDDLVDVDGVLRAITVRTDAAGAITGFAANALEGTDQLVINLFSLPVWFAAEGICAGGDSACVIGTPTLSVRLVAEVPEPAPLLLALVALAGLIALRRRRTARADGIVDSASRRE
jgi:MYXO-CTERM domain-containing protein